MLRQYPRALQDLDEAIRLNPSYPNALRNRALARRAAGDVAGSAEDLAREQALLKH